MAKRSLPTPEELRQLLDYDPETGVFTWRERSPTIMPDSRARNSWNARYARKVAGTINARGYVKLRISYVEFGAHRVAWAMVYGEWPKSELDHIDRDPANNRIVNLREATRSENCRNRRVRSDNTSGVSGVNWHSGIGKWTVRINQGGRTVCVGSFALKEDAIKARREAEDGLGYL